jgi:hypothetical protein
VPEPRSNTLHVAGKEGYVWYFDNNAATTTKTQLLNISARVQVTDNTGLVGLAFHPEWGLAGSPNRGYFYVFYYYSPAPIPVPDNAASPQAVGYNRISRFTKLDGQTVADPNSELVLLQQFDRHDWHGGGPMFFGPDGFLYFSIGDEGGNFDGWRVGFLGYNTAQSRSKGLNGGVFRIDVDNNASRSHPIRRQPVPAGTPPAGWPASFSANYMIPDDNPWLHADGSQLEEYWCLGLRSPHTMMQDPATGNIYVGDVGDEQREEINLIKKGSNYQWAYKQADLNAYQTKPSPLVGTDAPPIHSYGRSTGVCVVCGPVYRGSALGSSLRGHLLFADHEFTKIWVLTLNADGTAQTGTSTNLNVSNFSSGFHQGLVSWGVDHNLEPYMVKIGDGYVDNTPQGTGKILKLVPAAGTVPDPPSTLTLLGAFSNLQTLTPAPGFVPYQPIEGFWSDGAAKQRWICVPNDGTPDTPAERIGTNVDPAVHWIYPVGTVIMKHFSLPVDDRTPAVLKKIETRFLIKESNGEWYGTTYRWRDDESDADLVPSAAQSRTFTIPTASGSRTQTWTYPSRNDCFSCHVSSAGTILGLRPHQLNSDILYPTTGRTGNQLFTMSSIGLMSPGWQETSLTSLAKAMRNDDFTGSNSIAMLANLEKRARSYLDSNCSYCHRQGGVVPEFDLRYTTPLNGMGILGIPTKKTYGIADERLIAPQNFAASIIHARANIINGTGNLTQMPPLFKSMVDTNGVLVLKEWIQSLVPTFYPGANGLVQEIHDGTTLSNLKGTGSVGLPTQSWTAATEPAPGGDVGFSVRWSGHVKVRPGDNWIFEVTAPSGGNFRLYVGGTVVIDRWTGTTAAIAYNGGVLATTEYLNFALEFKDTIMPAGISSVRYRNLTQNTAFVSIPATAFFQPGTAPVLPLAVSDAASVSRGATRTISILTNDVDNSLNPASVSIWRQPTRGTVSVNSSGVATYVHNPALGGGLDTFVYTVNDNSGYTSNRAVVNLTVASHSQIWRNTYFSLADQQNPAIGGWQGDADGDSVVNLLEYALGTIPTNPNSVPSIGSSIFEWQGDRSVQIFYPRVPDAEVTLSAETSSSLTNWNPSDPAAQLSHPAANQTLIQFPIQPGMKKFGRLKVRLME